MWPPSFSQHSSAGRTAAGRSIKGSSEDKGQPFPFGCGAHPGSKDQSRSAAGDRPQRGYKIKRGATPSPIELDRLKIKRAGLTIGARTDVVAEALADSGVNILVPRNRALFEAEVVAAGFLFDFAMTSTQVKRLHCSKVFHDDFLR